MPPIGIVVIINIDRKGWPDSQIPPDRGSGCAVNSQLEAVRSSGKSTFANLPNKLWLGLISR